MKNIIYTLIICTLGISACGNDDDGSGAQLEMDIQLITDYLDDNSLTAERTESGLHFIVSREGSGPNPTIQDEVTVRYRGYFLDGTEFDATEGNNTISFPLRDVIQGWQEGIPKFKAGGSGILLIPSALGYGTSGFLSVPPNTVLLFDIDLVSF